MEVHPRPIFKGIALLLLSLRKAIVQSRHRLQARRRLRSCRTDSDIRSITEQPLGSTQRNSVRVFFPLLTSILSGSGLYRRMDRHLTPCFDIISGGYSSGSHVCFTGEIGDMAAHNRHNPIDRNRIILYSYIRVADNLSRGSVIDTNRLV